MPAAVPKPTFAQRFLEGKTSGQRLVLSLGALAGALTAIVGLVTLVIKLADRGSNGSSSLTSEATIANQSKDADTLVRELLAREGKTVALDHKVLGKPGPGDVSLQYDCSKPAGCSTVRIQSPTDAFDQIPDGVWIQGCFSVVRDGAGYGAEGLDIELHEQGATCPA